MNILRYLMALGVAASHYGFYIWRYNQGIMAVVGFMLLSGYVMTLLITKHFPDVEHIPLFYVDRLGRLLPQFLFYSASIVLLMQFTRLGEHSLQGDMYYKTCSLSLLAQNFSLFGNNFYHSLGRCVLIPATWSLGLESCFYLVIPWVILLPSRWLRLGVAGITVAVFLIGFFGLIDGDLYGFRSIAGTLFIFMTGGAMARSDIFGKKLPLFTFIFAAILWWCCLQHPEHRIHPNLKSVLAGLVLGIPLLAAVIKLTPIPKTEIWGNISYGLFLNHLLIKWIGQEYWGVYSWNFYQFCVAITCATLLSYVTYRFIERPIIQMRHTFRMKLQDRNREHSYMTTYKIFLTRKFIPLVYIISMAWSGIYGLLHPFYNWDMLCYVGSVISWSEKNPIDVHAKTMITIRDNIPDWVFQQHAVNILSRESSAFVDQIPLCQIKPLYTGSIWLLHQTGMSLPQASWTVSSICFMIMATLLFLWKPACMSRNLWLLLVMLISFVWEIPLGDVGRLSTPDSMGTMLSLAAFYAWLQRRSFTGFAALACLSTLARPDAMIIMSFATVYFAVLAPQAYRYSYAKAGILLAALAVCYGAFKYAFGSYTFAQYFIHSLVAYSPHPGKITMPLTPDLYWAILKGSFLRFFTLSRVITLSLIALTSLIIYTVIPTKEQRMYRDLLLLTLLSWSTRFILWPSWGDYRFYFTYSVMLLYTSGELLGPLVQDIFKLIGQKRAVLIAERKVTISDEAAAT